eukprot:g6180.t1
MIALPLNIAAPTDKDHNLLNMPRMKMVNTFVGWLQQGRYEDVESAAVAANPEGPANIARANAYVGVEDLVHFLCDSFSPAVSYAICVGKLHKSESGELNMGEGLVQRPRSGTTKQQRQAMFPDKEAGLVKLFTDEPGTYDLKERGKDQRGRVCYSVRMTIVDLADDSDSSHDE